MFNTWQFNLVGYLVFVVLFYQLFKVAVKKAEHDGAATILLQFIGGISILALAPLLSFKFPSDWRIYLLLAFASVFYAINDRLQTTARKHLEVSTISIVTQLSNVFLIVIGFTIFKDQLLISKVIGAALILLGNVFLFYKKGSLNINKYTWIAIMATLAFATAISIDIGISKQFNLLFYIMLTLIIPALMILLGERIPLSHVLQEWHSTARNYYLATGVAWGLTIFFSLRAFQLGKVSLIVPLEATSVLLNVFVAYLVFKERDNLAKKAIAAVLVIAGICLTVF